MEVFNIIHNTRTRDGVLEDCPRARGQLEDPKSWPWPWPLTVLALALALASTHRPPVTGLLLMCSIVVLLCSVVKTEAQFCGQLVL